MYVSSFKKNHFLLRKSFILILLSVALLAASLRFIVISAPYAESRARYLATDAINTCVNKYMLQNQKAFSNIININSTSQSVTYASVNTAELNSLKATLTTLINNALSETTVCTVNVPLATYLGIPFLSGIAAPLKIKMHPVSRVLIDFEKKFTSAGINQTNLSLNLKVTVSVLVTTPGIRRSVKVQTDIPVGDAVFMGTVPNYFSGDKNLPAVFSDK